MLGSAVFGQDKKYRFLLRRVWDVETRSPHKKPIMWVGLNPSIADQEKNDPTIRRIIGFSSGFGYNSMVMANLYALISTDPKGLSEETDLQAGNFEWVESAAKEADKIVCCWGANADEDTAKKMIELLMEYHDILYCLGTTKNGSPKHPLYLAKKTELIPFVGQ